MMGGRTSEEWIAQYATSHQHPVNRTCHTVGIPMIAVSIPLALAAWAGAFDWRVPAALFVVGWILQFVGHAIEGNQPAFFRNPVYLIVGPLWLLRGAFGLLGGGKAEAPKQPGANR